MKHILIGVCLVFLITMATFSQTSNIELTFSASSYGQFVQADSILIENLTQGCDTVLYYPDTVLILELNTDIGKNHKQQGGGFIVYQNFPNPYIERTEILVFSPKSHIVVVNIIDDQGRNLCKLSTSVDRGVHSFILTGGTRNAYVLNLQCDNVSLSRQIVCMGNHASGHCMLTYNGRVSSGNNYKATEPLDQFVFALGDSLRFTGYAVTLGGFNASDVMTDTPFQSQTYYFDIIEGLPCPGMPLFYYEGETYSTVQIGTQCWMKENLNIGLKINGNQNQTNNGITEKYCYDNLESNCDIYGGLYQWNEMMQYVTNQGAKGICPDGWHIPTDTEWTNLTTYLGGDQVAGGKMKEPETYHWASPNIGATNASGFTALPSGGLDDNGNFITLTYDAVFWTSSQESPTEALLRDLNYNNDDVASGYNFKHCGLSCRCLRD